MVFDCTAREVFCPILKLQRELGGWVTAERKWRIACKRDGWKIPSA